jgi:hypothetical protein
MPRMKMPACRTCGREEVRTVPSLPESERELAQLKRQEAELERLLKKCRARQAELEEVVARCKER